MKTDDEIKDCLNNPFPSPCQGCPDHTRCIELIAQKYEAEFGTDPPEEIEYTIASPGEWRRPGPPSVEYEVDP